MPKIRLTTTALRTLVPQCTDRIYWDETLPGFGVKVTPKGHRCYVVQYRNSYGVDRRMTLSDVRVLTIEQARTRAKEVLAKVTLGGDPAKDKQDDRKCITINDILDLYMVNHIEQTRSVLTGQCIKIMCDHLWELSHGRMLPKMIARNYSIM